MMLLRFHPYLLTYNISVYSKLPSKFIPTTFTKNIYIIKMGKRKKIKFHLNNQLKIYQLHLKSELNKDKVIEHNQKSPYIKRIGPDLAVKIKFPVYI